jgi:hypothetical protein
VKPCRDGWIFSDSSLACSVYNGWWCSSNYVVNEIQGRTYKRSAFQWYIYDHPIRTLVFSTTVNIVLHCRLVSVHSQPTLIHGLGENNIIINMNGFVIYMTIAETFLTILFGLRMNRNQTTMKHNVYSCGKDIPETSRAH